MAKVILLIHSFSSLREGISVLFLNLKKRVSYLSSILQYLSVGLKVKSNRTEY